MLVAWGLQDGVCPICHRKISLKAKKEMRPIGHHIVNRSKGGKSVVENCECRHADCEAIAHKKWRDGNQPKIPAGCEPVGYFFRPR